MLIEQIRSASSSEHTQLEKTLFPYLENLKTEDDYKLLLQAFYGYVMPVQELIFEHIDKKMIPDLDQRRSAVLILRDLGELKANENIKLCSRLPNISSHPSALGALYVLEGSTLGGKIISKMISGKLNNPEAFHFFNGYGENTGKMWKAFLMRLELNENTSHNGIIVESVRETFSLFDKWLKPKLEKNDGKQANEC